MGLKPDDLHTGEGSVVKLGGWHANLIYINRRKCVLFTNDKTLLNFLVPDLSRSEIRELSDQFRNNLYKLLQEEGVDDMLQNRIMEDYQQISYGKTTSRSVLGSMTDLAYHYTFHTEIGGGLKQCDMRTIIKAMNRMPMSAISYNSPIVEFSELYAIDGSKLSP